MPDTLEFLPRFFAKGRQDAETTPDEDMLLTAVKDKG
jgi:hypothetical protein